jgi:hypothetical protein
MPVGIVVIPGWYISPAIKKSAGGSVPMLPGGMTANPLNGLFTVIVAGWVAFLGSAPL